VEGEKHEGIDRIVTRQPSYGSMVRLGPTRFGLTVMLADGTTVVHELGSPNQQ
jgi:hypothetical protein